MDRVDWIAEPDFYISPHLRDFLPASTKMQTDMLETLVVETRGPTDPLVVWDEENVLVDGHRRYAICKRFSLDYEINRMSFRSLDDVEKWMLRLQISRRNLDGPELSEMIAKLNEKQLMEGATKVESIHMIADETGMSNRSVYRHLERHRIQNRIIPEWRCQIGVLKLSQNLELSVADIDPIKQLQLLAKCKTARDLTPLRKYLKKCEMNSRADGITFRSVDNEPDVEHYTPAMHEELVAAHKQVLPAFDSSKRLSSRKLLGEALEALDAATKSCDVLFSEQGLDARISVLKNKIDLGFRQVRLVLNDVNERLLEVTA